MRAKKGLRKLKRRKEYGLLSRKNINCNRQKMMDNGDEQNIGGKILAIVLLGEGRMLVYNELHNFKTQNF